MILQPSQFDFISYIYLPNIVKDISKNEYTFYFSVPHICAPPIWSALRVGPHSQVFASLKLAPLRSTCG